MARVKYDVDMVRQQYSPVCWLACAAMLVQFKRGQTPSSEALGIAGIDFRHQGLTVPREEMGSQPWDDHLRALGFTVARCAGVDGPSAVASEELIYWVLQQHGPFILSHYCGSFWYGAGIPVPSSGLHSVLVTGIDTDKGGCWFNNPWGRTDIPTTTASLVGAMRRYEAGHPQNYPVAHL
jgi:hypothetical protein